MLETQVELTKAGRLGTLAAPELLAYEYPQSERKVELEASELFRDEVLAGEVETRFLEKIAAQIEDLLNPEAGKYYYYRKESQQLVRSPNILLESSRTALGELRQQIADFTVTGRRSFVDILRELLNLRVTAEALALSLRPIGRANAAIVMAEETPEEKGKRTLEERIREGSKGDPLKFWFNVERKKDLTVNEDIRTAVILLLMYLAILLIIYIPLLPPEARFLSWKNYASWRRIKARIRNMRAEEQAHFRQQSVKGLGLDELHRQLSTDIELISAPWGAQAKKYLALSGELLKIMNWMLQLQAGAFTTIPWYSRKTRQIEAALAPWFGAYATPGIIHARCSQISWLQRRIETLLRYIVVEVHSELRGTNRRQVTRFNRSPQEYWKGQLNTRLQRTRKRLWSNALPLFAEQRHLVGGVDLVMCLTSARQKVQLAAERLEGGA